MRAENPNAHQRWNVQGKIETMDELREAFGSGADSLNWLVPYGAMAHDDEGENLSCDMMGNKGIAFQFEGYAIMPRVGGCSRVELVQIEDPEDMLYVADLVADTMLILMGNAGDLVNSRRWIKTKLALDAAHE